MAGFALRSLIRLAVTVAIIAAIYLFLLKPVLDTTSNTFDKAFDGNGEVVEQIREQLDSAGIDNTDVTLPSAKKAQLVLRCMQRAGADAAAVQRCAERFN